MKIHWNSNSKPKMTNLKTRINDESYYNSTTWPFIISYVNFRVQKERYFIDSFITIENQTNKNNVIMWVNEFIHHLINNLPKGMWWNTLQRIIKNTEKPIYDTDVHTITLVLLLKKSLLLYGIWDTWNPQIDQYPFAL